VARRVNAGEVVAVARKWPPGEAACLGVEGGRDGERESL